VEVAAQRGQRDRDHRHVDRDHEDRDADRGQRGPAGAWHVATSDTRIRFPDHH
jgi:hypothetical protein